MLSPYAQPSPYPPASRTTAAVGRRFAEHASLILICLWILLPALIIRGQWTLEAKLTMLSAQVGLQFARDPRPWLATTK